MACYHRTDSLLGKELRTLYAGASHCCYSVILFDYMFTCIKVNNCKILAPPETRIELSIQVFLQSRYCYLHCFEAPFSTISVQFMPCVNASLSYSSIRPRSHNLARSGSRRTAPKYGIPADLARSAPLLGPNK